MVSEIRQGFDRYWADRVPGMVEFARYVLNNDTDFNYTIRLFLRDISVDSKVLDVGTGVGLVAIEMARMGFEVKAMDCVPEAIDAAKELSQKMEVSVDYILGDVTHPDLPKGSFDIIIARNCVWNLEDPKTAYSNWRGLLRPGG